MDAPFVLMIIFHDKYIQSTSAINRMITPLSADVDPSLDFFDGLPASTTSIPKFFQDYDDSRQPGVIREKYGPRMRHAY